jgi:hypothetical protein
MPELATEIFHIIYLFIAPTKMNGQRDENTTTTAAAAASQIYRFPS